MFHSDPAFQPGIDKCHAAVDIIQLVEQQPTDSKYQTFAPVEQGQ